MTDEEYDAMPEKTCPKCGAWAKGEDLINEMFGYRTAAVRPQSYCKNCRVQQGKSAIIPSTTLAKQIIEEPIRMKQDKACTNCGVMPEVAIPGTKPRSHHRLLNGTKLHPWCMNCENVAKRDYTKRKKDAAQKSTN